MQFVNEYWENELMSMENGLNNRAVHDMSGPSGDGVPPAFNGYVKYFYYLLPHEWCNGVKYALNDSCACHASEGKGCLRVGKKHGILPSEGVPPGGPPPDPEEIS